MNLQQHPDASDLDEGRPRWIRRLGERMSVTWVGRTVFEVTMALRRVEIFDRSMTLAAQFFTSVFPLLILVGLWLGRGDADNLAEELDLPSGTRAVLQSAFAADTTAAAFGVVGSLFVIISGTSLSRALTRAYAVVWRLPRPKASLRYAWRWVVVLVALALFLIASPVVRNVMDDIPPNPTLWDLVSVFVLDATIAVLVPVVLVERQVAVRHLLPGAVLFAVAMTVARPVVDAYLPVALANSSGSYGTIGVAFTYISYLYAVAFAFLGSATIGQVLVCDQGWLGARLRGARSVPPGVR